MYVPSYDFGLFDVREFSPLQMNEFGADTYFSANTPLSYVDYALNQMSGLTQPNNPTPYVSQSMIRTAPRIIPEELQQFFQQRDNITVYPAGQTPPELQHKGGVVSGTTVPCTGKPWYWRYLGWCCPFEIVNGECVLHSDDSSVGIVNPSGGRVDLNSALGLSALPQGAGVFLIGVIILVLLILFVRR